MSERMSGTGPHPAEKGDPLSVEELRMDIAAQRAELGDTVAALAHRADVKARVREGRARAVDRTREAARRAVAAAEERWPVQAATVRRSPQTAAAVAGGALLLVWLVARRVRRGRRARAGG